MCLGLSGIRISVWIFVNTDATRRAVDEFGKYVSWVEWH